MPIFYNESIFDSGVDYEIGGFEIHRTDNITFGDIFEGYASRVSDYIDEYLDIAINTYALQGYENPQQEGLNALVSVVEDLLKVEIKFYSKEEILNSILNSDQSQTWLNTIKDRINKYQGNISVVAEQFGITSETNHKTELYKEAVEIMEDSSLETILERLSTIIS
jgi:hypothetical protein